MQCVKSGVKHNLSNSYCEIKVSHFILNLAFAQSIIIKLSTVENVKSVEIWDRLNVQLVIDTLSSSQVCKGHKVLNKWPRRNISYNICNNKKINK